METDTIIGLEPTTPDNFNYLHAVTNTQLIQESLNNSESGQKLVIPEGIYDVETLFLPTGISDIIISGAGIHRTILRRAGFQWDNNTQGNCPLRTEILVASNVSQLTLTGLTLDGNSHHLAISGYGQWNTSTGAVISGLPQFPTFISTNQYQNSAGSVLNIRLSNDININDVCVRNGFRWAITLGKIDGLVFQHNIISTGNLSTEFKGHFDAPPNNSVMHMHTSQDGLHMVNVSNAKIEYNDIHSEDSGIAIEVNPLWNWGGYDLSENVEVNNNYINTLSPSNEEDLLNDDDIIYGSGLADEWTGQGGVDIFYNEMYDQNGTFFKGGANGPFRNIKIYRNSIDGARYGVRAGFFIGAGTYNANHFNHRIFNIHVYDHNKNFSAGRDSSKISGIRNILKNTHPNSWNQTGGAGIAIRNSDSVRIENNEIMDVQGGVGVDIVNVTRFFITHNTIDKVSGSQLGIPNWFDWKGGNGIRIWNDYRLLSDPNLVNGYFDAKTFLIEENYIGGTELQKIGVYTTKNGIVRRDLNYNLQGENLCNILNGLILDKTLNIETGNCWNSLLASDTFEDDTPWVNYDQEGAPVALNNALGGETNYSWSPWAGIAVNDGNSAVGGTKCLQAHWGGIANIRGFIADPDETYQLELLVHPPSGNDGTWNNWAAIHLYTFDNTDVWQNQGFRIRLMNGGPGGNPNNLAVDYWEGETGEYKIDFAYSWAENPSGVYINGANAAAFWIPVKIIFSGQGTTESPVKIDYYINNILRKSSIYNNIVWTGDRMIGLSNNGNDGDVARFDNIKLTRLQKTVNIRENELKPEHEIHIYPNPAGDYIQLEMSVKPEKGLVYLLYDMHGRLLENCEITNDKQYINLEKYEPSIYYIQVQSGNSIMKTLKVIKR
ncbi:MAG: T9SS type A sorting domain-containing protein [Bacteroidales bacterium]|nr:T9SS type A sorting domain-containing protein [Bacteroidales bacterium]